MSLTRPFSLRLAVAALVSRGATMAMGLSQEIKLLEKFVSRNLDKNPLIKETPPD
jgi:hypothetical protein